MTALYILFKTGDRELSAVEMSIIAIIAIIELL